MDKYEKLKELKTLLDNGVLNQDEFNKLKNEILFSDDVIPKNDSGYNTFSKSEGFDNEQNDSTKSDIKSNVYEDIAFKYVQNVKKKSNNNLILFIVIAGIIIFFYNYDINSNTINSNDSIQDSKTTTTEELVENESTICTICGRNFTGDGYDKIDGVWQRNTNMQTELCSQNCAMVEDQRQNQKYNDILVKHGYEPIDDSQSSSSNHSQPNGNGFFTGSDGQLHQASPCGNCHHTGYVEMGDGMQVCPMCDGKGEKIY
jgi:hypothetical protein